MCTEARPVRTAAISLRKSSTALSMRVFICANCSFRAGFAAMDGCAIVSPIRTEDYKTRNTAHGARLTAHGIQSGNCMRQKGLFSAYPGQSVHRIGAVLEARMGGTYEDLRVWRSSMELVYAIYEATQEFPKHELYGLVSQLRRAAVSIPSNIAEGKGRSTQKDLNVFLCHSRGSLHELETQLLISRHLGYLQEAGASRLLNQCKDVGRMLHGLISVAVSG